MEKLQLFLAFVFFLCVESDSQLWSVPEGEEVTLTCTVVFLKRVINHERPKHFVWTQENNGIMNRVADCTLDKCEPLYGVPHTFTVKKNSDSAATSSMTIHRVTKYHEGFWLCKNAVLNSPPWKLIVFEPGSKICPVFEGQKITLICKLYLNLYRSMVKQLFWSKRVPNDLDYHYQATCEEDNVCKGAPWLSGTFTITRPNATTAILKMTIPSVRKTDEGSWYCHGTSMIQEYPELTCDLKINDFKMCLFYRYTPATLTCKLSIDYNRSQNKTLFWINKVNGTYHTLATCEENNVCHAATKRPATFTMTRPNAATAILKMAIPSVDSRDEGSWFCYGPTVIQNDPVPVCILEVIV